MNNVQFQTAEQKGRELLNSILKQWGAEDILFTPGTFDRVDCYAMLNGQRVSFEIKVRNLIDKRTGQPYVENMLETSKILAMCKDAKEKGLATTYYVCFFQDMCYMYDLRKTKFIRQADVMCPRTTVQCTDYIKKHVAYFITENAEIYKYLGGRWYANNKQAKEKNLPKDRVEY